MYNPYTIVDTTLQVTGWMYYASWAWVVMLSLLGISVILLPLLVLALELLPTFHSKYH
jgi:hypothetical protein